jgi:hypothetical protein
MPGFQDSRPQIILFSPVASREALQTGAAFGGGKGRK